MSSNLYAEPVERKKLSLGTGLKFALRKRYGEPIDTGMNENDFSFLDGIAAGNEQLKDDVEKLMEYIRKHGSVHVREEF